jgi:hypothetical protein
VIIAPHLRRSDRRVVEQRMQPRSFSDDEAVAFLDHLLHHQRKALRWQTTTLLPQRPLWPPEGRAASSSTRTLRCMPAVAGRWACSEREASC